MKANEFVKRFGWNSFKAAMVCPQFKRYNYAILYSDEVDFSNDFIEKHTDYMFKTSDIKRLVESHELVESYGGLDMAKNVLDIEIHAKHYDYDATKVTQLAKAISDVESCQ